MQETETEYIFGGPWFGGLPTSARDSFVAPVGQVDLYYEFLKKMSEDIRSLVEQGGKEYIAILAAMAQMGIKFHIVHLNGIPQLDGLAAIFEKGFGSDVVCLSRNITHELAFYPRDMYGYLQNQNAVLLNSQIRNIVKIPDKRLSGIYFSSYGEGGSALYAKDIMIVGNRYVDGNIVFKNDQSLDILKRKGLKVIVIPSPAIRTFSRNSLGDKAGIDEHLDRSMNLIEGLDGRLYLIVDPNVHLAAGKNVKKEFSLIEPEEAIEIIKGICEPFDINVICPPKINIPCSLGFMQFANKKVLMTSGDDAVYDVLEKIVGRENVVQTRVPIIATAIFGRAGIRCTINEYPAIMREIFPPLA